MASRELTNWRLLGASVTGTSHTKSGLPCQDAHAYREVAGCALLVVADGAGSAQRSAEGAQCATQAAVSALAAALTGGLAARLHLFPDPFPPPHSPADAQLEQLSVAARLPAP